jgi:hypothetical protein
LVIGVVAGLVGLLGGRFAESSSFKRRGSRLIAASRLSAVPWAKPVSSCTSVTGNRLRV